MTVAPSATPARSAAPAVTTPIETDPVLDALGVEAAWELGATRARELAQLERSRRAAEAAEGLSVRYGMD